MLTAVTTCRNQRGDLMALLKGETLFAAESNYELCRKLYPESLGYRIETIFEKHHRCRRFPNLTREESARLERLRKYLPHLNGLELHEFHLLASQALNHLAYRRGAHARLDRP